MMNLLFAAALAQTSPIMIYPVGDSITHGVDHDGYRRALAQRLREGGVAFRFVGTLTDGSPALTERLHDGHDGWTIEDLTRAIGPWLARFKPDVILLMIGANDVESGADLTTLGDRYRRLLDVIAGAAPSARILVSEISLIRDPHYDRMAVAFNQDLKAIVEKDRARGRRSRFVPMHDVLTSADLLDLDHPTPVGNAKLAERWWSVLKCLKCD